MSVAPDPTPTPTPTQSKTLTERYGVWITPIALVLLFIASNRGWLSPTQVEIIKPFVMSANENETTTETITVEKTTVPTVDPAAAVKPKPKPVPAPAPVVKPVEAVTPEDIKQWAELIKLLIEQLKPQPVPPIPPVPIPPQPIPPTPTPIDPPPIIIVPPKPIQPTPGTLKIVVSDKRGTPITSATIESGKWFRVSATGAASVAWQTDQGGNPEFGASGDGSEFTGYLHDGDWISFTAIDYAGKANVTTRITSLTGPRPPPGPVDPIIDPIPPTPTVTQVSLAVVYDAKAITPSAAIVMNATATWQAFAAAGNSWRFYDRATSEPAGKAAVANAGSSTLPTLVICDKTSGVKLDAIPLPKTVDELKAVVAKYTGGQS